MSGYTIEIRTGVNTEDHIAHTWVHVIRPDGSAEAWGFYPDSETGNPYYGDGQIRSEDTEQDFTASSGPISITEEQYQEFTTNLPTYNNLPYGNPSVPPSYSIPFEPLAK